MLLKPGCGMGLCWFSIDLKKAKCVWLASEEVEVVNCLLQVLIQAKDECEGDALILNLTDFDHLAKDGRQLIFPT